MSGFTIFDLQQDTVGIRRSLLRKYLGLIGATIAVAEDIPIEQADRIVGAVLSSFEIPHPGIKESPEREHLAALIRPRPQW